MIIFVMEGKRSNLGQAKKQYMLVLNNMRDNNSGNILYIVNNFQALSLWVNKESRRDDRCNSSS